MARKTTKAAQKAIHRFDEALKHYEEVIRIKALPEETQANHIREKSLDYFEGWIHGIQSMTESILHDENCYHGFHYVDSKGEWLTADGLEYITEHPEYRCFRVSYYTK